MKTWRNRFKKKAVDPTKHSAQRAFIEETREIFDANPDKSYITVCVDMVGFRLYNEKFGVETGDKFLIYMADKIKGYTTLKNGVLSSCYGSSDKFFMCMTAERFDPDKLAFDLREMFRKWSLDYELTAKFGIIKSDGRSDPGQNCDRAQMAVNTIKTVYGKTYAYYENSMLDRVMQEAEMAKEMNGALIHGEFIPFFQPQYDAQSKEIVGAELLVRWNSPKKGFISPQEFVPLFEKNGCITEIDMYLWSMGCTLLRKWREKGYKLSHISVNVSRTDFYHPGIAEYMKGLVEKNRLSPKDVHIEITESAYFENYDQFIVILNKFIGYGFVIEIDDFGSGYSSLNMLKDLKFDVVKLDKEFIQEETTERGRLVVGSIVEMIKKIGMKIVTEGIETEEQYEFVKSIGADVIQGFYFSKPVPTDDFERLIKK